MIALRGLESKTEICQVINLQLGRYANVFISDIPWLQGAVDLIFAGLVPGGDLNVEFCRFLSRVIISEAIQVSIEHSKVVCSPYF